MKKIVAVINQKGGVGKTTTSINFSCGLALKGHKTLLVDMDPQAHSTMGMNIEPGTFKYGMHDILINKQNVKETILPTKIKNLSILPSHIRLDKAEQRLTTELYRETRLYRAIEDLKYDFIIIDCRPTLGTLTINALYACNFIIVPCEMSRYSLEGFADLMDTIETVKNDVIRDKGHYIRILLTKFNSRATVTNDWIFDQLTEFNHMQFKTKIRQNEALNQAHMAMEPIFSFKPNSHGAEDYKHLTSEFLKLCQQQEIN